MSIIIPALNEGERIAEAVRRALALRPHELFVVDGESEDETARLARAAGAEVLTSVRGRAHQQNVGAQRATGDVLLFLHADTWLAADGRAQMEASLSDARVLSGAFRQQIDAAGRIYRLLERGNAWRAARRGLPYGDQGLFVRREAFEGLGGFPDVPIMEDVLLMRALRRHARPALLPGPLHVSARRWRKQGVVRQTLRNWALLTALACGVSPQRLAQYYAPHRE